MPFTSQYKPFIESEKSVSKTLILPRNVYRITSYKYSDGEQKSLSGDKASLVFVTGIFDKKIYCVKISEVKPDMFFKWLKTIMLKNLKEEDFSNLKLLENLTIKTDKAGKRLYSTLKGKSIINQNIPSFRTYILPNIKQISLVEFKMEAIEKVYGIKKANIEKK